MKQIKSVYFNGQFAVPRGTETADIICTLDRKSIGLIVYANEEDAWLASSAAAVALETYCHSTIALLFFPALTTLPTCHTYRSSQLRR